MKKSKGILFILILILFGEFIYLYRDEVVGFMKSIYEKRDLFSLSMITDGYLVNDDELKSLEDSGITGENLSFDTTYYKYYTFLNSEQQTLYRQAYANAMSLKKTFVPIVDINYEDVTRTIEALYNDHPEIFWINTKYTYKYTEDGKCVQVTLDFNETADNLDYHKELFESSANKIIAKARNLSSSYEKEKYVHDAIILLADYNKASTMTQSAYSALVNHQTVCAGYSRSFQYIMIKLGVPTFYVTGRSDEDHAWNIVYLSDGYYNVDLTWDDKGKIIYNYFNMSDTVFNKTHQRSDFSKLLPSCNGSIYSNLEGKKKTNTQNKIPTNDYNNIPNTYESSNNVSDNNNSNIIIDNDEKINDSNNEKNFVNDREATDISEDSNGIQKDYYVEDYH